MDIEDLIAEEQCVYTLTEAGYIKRQLKATYQAQQMCIRDRLEPGRELTVICGNNGQGKTNLLEAIWLLTGGKSFRGGKDAELVRRGEAFAVLEADTQRDRPEGCEPAEPAHIRMTVGTPEAAKPGRYAAVNGAAPKLSLIHI